MTGRPLGRRAKSYQGKQQVPQTKALITPAVLRWAREQAGYDLRAAAVFDGFSGAIGIQIIGVIIRVIKRCGAGSVAGGFAD